eukprot:TRINITY_DN20737_c0_g1_i1.p1 TRINITY_DN20737_c0_g1~~TRINITY_DN20737_c0_g1_i1.p1  ORF type:complete len:687 (-),score=176.78 TRINITY_DN20737_c0_g1_i1:12-2072(-)
MHQLWQRFSGQLELDEHNVSPPEEPDVPRPESPASPKNVSLLSKLAGWKALQGIAGYGPGHTSQSGKISLPVGWAPSFPQDDRGERGPHHQPDAAPPFDLDAFRNLARRAHQLLARQQRRAVASHRAAECENCCATERLGLALAEADDLEEQLQRYAAERFSARGWLPASQESSQQAEVESAPEPSVFSGHPWSAEEIFGRRALTRISPHAAEGVLKPADILRQWQSEDAQAQLDIQVLSEAMTAAGSELRCRLPPPPSMRQTAATGRVKDLPAALLCLARSCADSMLPPAPLPPTEQHFLLERDAMASPDASPALSASVEAAEDAWAAGEASVLETFTHLIPPAVLESQGFGAPAAGKNKLFSGQGETASDELAWLMVSGEDEARDQAALNRLLQRLEVLGQRLEEQSSSELSPETVPLGWASPVRRGPPPEQQQQQQQQQSQWLLSNRSLQPSAGFSPPKQQQKVFATPEKSPGRAELVAQLEARVQGLLAENVSLEQRLKASQAAAAKPKAPEVIILTQMNFTKDVLPQPAAAVQRRRSHSGMTPAEKLALSTRLTRQVSSNCSQSDRSGGQLSGSPAASEDEAQPVTRPRPVPENVLLGRQRIAELRSELADAYEALATRSLLRRVQGFGAKWKDSAANLQSPPRKAPDFQRQVFLPSSPSIKSSASPPPFPPRRRPMRKRR